MRALSEEENSFEREKPCKHCGGHFFYIKGRDCVTCKRAKSQKRQAERRKGIAQREANKPTTYSEVRWEHGFLI